MKTLSVDVYQARLEAMRKDITWKNWALAGWELRPSGNSGWVVAVNERTKMATDEGFRLDTIIRRLEKWQGSYHFYVQFLKGGEAGKMSVP